MALKLFVACVELPLQVYRHNSNVHVMIEIVKVTENLFLASVKLSLQVYRHNSDVHVTTETVKVTRESVSGQCEAPLTGTQNLQQCTHLDRSCQGDP